MSGTEGRYCFQSYSCSHELQFWAGAHMHAILTCTFTTAVLECVDELLKLGAV